MKLMNFTKRAAQAGFTMIELLVVIAILGILAVAVLAAINPIEQINRGRDTAGRSDAEQLIGALDRYNALRGFAAWQADITSMQAIPITQVATSVWMTRVTGGFPGYTTCPVFTRLGSTTSNVAGCENTDELKSSFTTRVSDPNYVTPLFVTNRGVNASDTTYVCFAPRSNAFRAEAATRCGGIGGAGLPEDLRDITGAAAAICTAGTERICLP